MKITSMERLQIQKVNLTESSDSKLNITLKAIHNCITKNFTNYTENALKASCSTWTDPYKKPVLKNHDIDEEPLGRVMMANYALDDSAKKGCVYLDAEITDPDAIEKIKDGRYNTVSIGSTSSSVKCSICGQNIATDGWCEHDKGEYYDGNLCYWEIDEMEPIEISFVNAPADIYAGVDKKDDIPPMTPMMPGMFGQQHIEFAHKLLHSIYEKEPNKEGLKEKHSKIVATMTEEYHIDHKVVSSLDKQE